MVVDAVDGVGEPADVEEERDGGEDVEPEVKLWMVSGWDLTPQR